MPSFSKVAATRSLSCSVSSSVAVVLADIWNSLKLAQSIFVADANTIVGEREWTTNRRCQYFIWFHFYAITPTLNNQKLKRWWWNIGDRELEIRVRPVNRRCAAYSRVPHEKHNIISQCDLTKNLRESQQVEKKDLGSRFEHPWAILFFRYT